MKFAKNRLYIERYTKCANCGILIFENSAPAMERTRRVEGKLYCSAWCLDWDAGRGARNEAEAAAP